MGSGAQDARHERILEEAAEEVAELEGQVSAKEAELVALKAKLAQAKDRLAFQQRIDTERD
jgi:predicted RNase H-like nuclease (RuvC/YqgF family)